MAPKLGSWKLNALTLGAVCLGIGRSEIGHLTRPTEARTH